MNWSMLFIIIIICIILLIICYMLKGEVEKKPNRSDKRCMNCQTKQYEDMMDIRCRNKKSEHYGTMVDDYACCNAWKAGRMRGD